MAEPVIIIALHHHNSKNKTKMLLIRTFFLSILLINTLNINNKDKSIFISPVKIPLLLSANFGELRNNHYHSGLDIKTEGVTGKEIVQPSRWFYIQNRCCPWRIRKSIIYQTFIRLFNSLWSPRQVYSRGR